MRLDYEFVTNKGYCWLVSNLVGIVVIRYWYYHRLSIAVWN